MGYGSMGRVSGEFGAFSSSPDSVGAWLASLPGGGTEPHPDVAEGMEGDAYLWSVSAPESAIVDAYGTRLDGAEEPVPGVAAVETAEPAVGPVPRALGELVGQAVVGSEPAMDAVPVEATADDLTPDMVG